MADNPSRRPYAQRPTSGAYFRPSVCLSVRPSAFSKACIFATSASHRKPIPQLLQNLLVGLMISPSDMTLDAFSPLKIAFENFKSVFFFPNFKIKGIRLWGVGEQNFLHISYFLNFPAMPSKNEKTLLEESNFRISFPGTGTCLSYRYAFFGDVFPHRGLPYCDARSMSFPFLKI